MFTTYVSNTACGTCANYVLDLQGKTLKAKCYFKPQMSGEFSYCFYFDNRVDSTYDQGAVAHVGQGGYGYEIVNARISVTPYIDFVENHPEGIARFGADEKTTPVTFDGKMQKSVMPNECFWSDAVRFEVPENHYLVWEWELTGDKVVCTPDSQIPAFLDTGKGYCQEYICPKPMLVGCDRKVKKRIAFWGDSITQGCGTAVDAYEMWVGEIAKMLAEEYAVWNLGMGWGRGSDADRGESWLYKAARNDTVVMTFGVNDLLHGAYALGRSNTAGEIVCTIESLIQKLQANGVRVILSTVPPFDFTKEQQIEWRTLNLAIPQIAKLYGCSVFDIEAALDGGGYLANDYSVYGAHPDGRGGKAAAKKFYQTFYTENGWDL